MRNWLSIWPWGFYDTVIIKAPNGRITDELERTNKEVILDKSMHYPGVCHGLRKYMGRYSWWHDQDSSAKYDEQNSISLRLYQPAGLFPRKTAKGISRVFLYTLHNEGQRTRACMSLRLASGLLDCCPNHTSVSSFFSLNFPLQLTKQLSIALIITSGLS